MTTKICMSNILEKGVVILIALVSGMLYNQEDSIRPE